MGSAVAKAAARRVRFGDLATCVNDRVDNPSEAGVDRYVGLEHLDSESLRIRRWGAPSDVEATKLLFRKGDIIFGRRRAYQRKLAVADFDGICSAHALVLRARPDVVLPEFLPFFMQSDLFMERALAISVGSLSPTINWKTLAQEEFVLPPLDEQTRLARAHGAVLAMDERLIEARDAANHVFTSLLQSLMSRGLLNESTSTTKNLVHPRSWPAASLESVTSVERGQFSHRPRNLPEFYGGPYPFVQTGDVAGSRCWLRSASQTLSEAGLQYSKSFPANSILLTIAATIGATAITTQETWCPDSLVGIVPKPEIDVRFLEYALRYVRPFLEFKVATQTAQKNINLQVLRPLVVPLPPFAVQAEVAAHLDRAEKAVAEIETRIAANRTLGHAMQSTHSEATR